MSWIPNWIMVNGEKRSKVRNLFQKHSMGFTWEKNDPFNPPIRGSILPLTVQHPTTKFPNCVKEGTTKKCPEEIPTTKH